MLFCITKFNKKNIFTKVKIFRKNELRYYNLSLFFNNIKCNNIVQKCIVNNSNLTAFLMFNTLKYFELE